MSDATTDFLISTLTDLLEVVVWGGLVAGLLLVWRPRLARRITRIQAGFGLMIAACLFACFLRRNSWVTVELGTWMTVHSHSIGAVRMLHLIDMLSTAFLLAFSAAILLASVESDNVRGFDRGDRSTATGVASFFFLQAALQFVLFDDAVMRIACLPLMSLCCLIGNAGDPDSTNSEIVAARRTFLFRTFADGLLLLAAGLCVHTGYPEKTFLIPEAGVLLWLGVLLRMVCYPFFDDDESSERHILERVLVLPAGVLILLRMRIAYSGAEAVEETLVYGGAILALLAAGISVTRPRGSTVANVTALAGMMLVGVGHGTPEGLQGAILLLVSQALLIPGLGSYVEDRSMPRLANAILLGSGFCGQGLILERLQLSGGSVFIVILFVAHAVTAAAIMRSAIINDGVRNRSRLPTNLFAVGLAVAITLAGHVASTKLFSGESRATTMLISWWPADAFAYAVVAILGAIGLTAGWMLRQRGAAVHTRPPGAFRRWLRAGCYLEEAFLLAVVLPLRGGAQLCRFFEWFIIERLWDLPRRAPAWLGRLGEPLRGGTVQMSVAAILLATAVLLGVIVGLGN